MLSKKANYAIHSLIYLAQKKDEGPVLISEIAKETKVPKKFLEAILLELKNAGILQSKKGQGGGYYLLKATKDVTLSQIMRQIDGPLALLPCATFKYYERCEECIDEETCGIRMVMKEVRDATVKILNNTSLEDVLKREERLKKKAGKV